MVVIFDGFFKLILSASIEMLVGIFGFMTKLIEFCSMLVLARTCC